MTNIVNIYAARTGWKSARKHSYLIKCSCFKPSCESLDATMNTSVISPRKFSEGSLNKSCSFKVVMKATQYDSKRSEKTNKLKSIANFGSNVPVIISDKSVLEHGGDCNPGVHQQMMQRS